MSFGGCRAAPCWVWAEPKKGKENDMETAVRGYYDGTQIVLNENIKLSYGQQVIVTILKSELPERNINPCYEQKERDMAFERLENWREKNKDFWGENFDWKKEVREALNEKYGLAD